MQSSYYIASTTISGEFFKPYFDIPMNEKLCFDIIIRNAKIDSDSETKDIAIQYQEILVEGKIHFKPIIDSIRNLTEYFGHLEIDAKCALVQCENGEPLFEGYENDFVLKNNELFALNLVNN